MRDRKVVRDGEMDSCFVLFGNQPRQPFGCASGQLHGWLAAGQIFNPHVAPEDAVAQAGAKGFGAGLLGREALGVRCCALSALIGFGPLRLGENPVQKAVPIAADRFFDTPDVDHVAADADNHAVPVDAKAALLLLLRGLLHARTLGNSPRDSGAHASDGGAEPSVDRFADEEMPNVQFGNLR